MPHATFHISFTRGDGWYSSYLLILVPIPTSIWYQVIRYSYSTLLFDDKASNHVTLLAWKVLVDLIRK